MRFYKLLVLSILFVSTKSFSQNTIVGPGFSTGWGGSSCPTTISDFSFLAPSFGTSYIGTFNANNTGNQFFRMGIDFSGTTSQLTQTPNDDEEITPGTIVSLDAACTTSGSMFINVPNSTFNYIFKTRDAGTNPTGDFVVFEVQGDVRAVSSVSQNPAQNDVFFGENVTVTATLDGNLNTGQGVYLRYSTDNFSSSTIIEMTGSGPTYAATIPDTVNINGNNIVYYVFTSGNGLNIAPADADFFTINLNNNSGNNFTYTVRGEYITQSGATTWNNPNSWRAGVVPPNDAQVIIAHDLDLTDPQSASSVSLENDANLNNSSTLTIQNNGNITNTNVLEANILSNVIFDGNGSVLGEVLFNNVSLNNSSTGVNFNTQTTINGTLMINAGGNVDTGSPIYNNGSTLIYNINGNYGRRSEWSNAGIQGFPHHVVLQNNTSLNMGADNNTTTAEISGNLNILDGSTLDMQGSNSMLVDLIIGENLENNGDLNASNSSSQNVSDIRIKGDFDNTSTGTINLSTTFGNDIMFEGHFTNSGTFNFNNRALFFTGNQAEQSLDANIDPYNIPFMVIDKPQGKVILNQNITLSGGLGGDVLDMRKSDPSDQDSALELNGHALQIGDGADSKIRMDSLSSTSYTKLIGDENSKIIFNSTNTDLDNVIRFSQNASNQENYLSEFEMQGSGTIAISDTLNIINRFVLNAGTFNSNGHLTFKSSESLTAVIPEVTGGTISGEVRVERHFPESNRAYRYVSSSVSTSPTSSKPSIHVNWQEGASTAAITSNPDPLDPNFNPNPGFGTHITGEMGPQGTVNITTGIDQTGAGNPSLWEYNQTEKKWDSIINTKSTNVIAGYPYALMVRGDRNVGLINSNTAFGPETILRTVGTPIIGSHTPILNGSISDGDFVFVGNPYQAQVDMSEILDGVNSTNFNTNYMWIWDPTIGTLGNYAVVELSSGIPEDEFGTPIPLTSEANEFLQPFQSCFLEATGNSPTITFVESAKRDDANQSDNIGTFSDDIASSNALEIELYRATTQTLFDAVKLRFDANYTTAPSFEDAKKLWNNTEHLAIINANQYLSIDKREFPQANDTIPLYAGNYQANQYTLQLDSGLGVNQTIFLYDAYLNQQLELENGTTTYNFDADTSVPESMSTDRFALIFNPEGLSSTLPEQSDTFRIFPNPVKDQLTIKLGGIESYDDLHVECFDVLGRLQFQTRLETGLEEQQLDVNSLSSGMYLLQISSKTQAYTQEFVKK